MSRAPDPTVAPCAFLTWHTASLAWLGVDGNTQADGGVKLTGVSSGSPAAAVHLLIGDRIRTINGTKVIDWNHLVHLVRQAGTGATVEVGLERDNSEAVVQVTIGSRLDSPQ